MNLNSETNYTTLKNDVNSDTGHFGQYPKPQVQRSRYNVPYRNTFTCNASKLIPFFWKYTMPNMTDSVDTKAVIRMQPTVHSPMSNVYADIYYFFVANKDLWTKDEGGSWNQFMGENYGQYVQTPISTYKIPQLSFPANGFSCKSVADYLGVPPEVKPTGNYSITALPFRAYAKVWNEFFRDENLSPEAIVYTGSTTQSGQTINQANKTPLDTASLGGDLLPVCRPHDMLGSCLPFPQKSDPADSLIDGSLTGSARVLTYDTTALPPVTSWTTPLEWVGPASVQQGLAYVTNSTNHPTVLAGATSGTISPSGTTIAPSNLWLTTGTSDLTSHIEVNSLRQSLALQHYFEALARGGSRYFEIISALYGTTIDPLQLDRPLYLGGRRIPISITNVIQNTPTGSDNKGLGQVAGYSCTGVEDNSFTYSYSQHGIVIGVMCIRSEKQYQQGLDRNFKLTDRLEFYTPNVFDGLGEMEVLKSDIYLGADNKNDEVFGYQEAYYWERYRSWNVAGEFRSIYSTPLDSWHLADDYASRPVLSGDIQYDSDAGEVAYGWIYDNTDENLDRVLQVESDVSDQFFVDLFVDDTVVSPLPVYSIPGIATV